MAAAIKPNLFYCPKLSVLDYLLISLKITKIQLISFTGDHMKKILSFLILIALSSNVLAISDKDCRNAYNSAFEKLISTSVDFNSGYIGNKSFAVEVAVISTEVSAVRGVCLAVESPSNKSCVQAYKKRYKALRNEIKIISVLTGNQTSVKPRVIQTISNEFSNIFSRAKCGDLNI